MRADGPAQHLLMKQSGVLQLLWNNFELYWRGGSMCSDLLGEQT